MLGGDEVSAVVVDVGGQTTRFGFAGEDTPRHVVPSYAGVATGDASGSAQMEIEGAESAQAQRKTYYVGSAALSYRRDGVEMQQISRYGQIEDWDALEQLIAHGLRDCMHVEAAEHPLLFTEPAFNPRATREKMTEIVFEKFGAPAFFLAKDAVLSAYAAGQATAMVVCMGEDTTAVVPVLDGYVLHKHIIRNHAVTGAMVRRQLEAILAAQGTTVVPHYGFHLEEAASGEWQVVYDDHPGTTDSYRDYRVRAIVDDVKQSLFEVASKADAAQYAAPGSADALPTTPYELPDRTLLEIGVDKFTVLEGLFAPVRFHATVAAQGGAAAMEVDGGAGAAAASAPTDFGAPDVPPTLLGTRNDSLGLQQMIYNALSSTDADVRKALAHAVVLSGGNALYPGLHGRLSEELKALLPSASAKVRVLPVSHNVERRFAPWIGGSILGSLGSFHQMWISKAEYDEHGKAIVAKKCP